MVVPTCVYCRNCFFNKNGEGNSSSLKELVKFFLGVFNGGEILLERTRPDQKKVLHDSSFSYFYFYPQSDD